MEDTCRFSSIWIKQKRPSFCSTDTLGVAIFCGRSSLVSISTTSTLFYTWLLAIALTQGKQSRNQNIINKMLPKKRFYRGTSICIAYPILWNYSHIIKNDSLVLINIVEHDNSFFYYIKMEIISLLSWNWPSSKQFLPDLISINKNTCSSTITADRTSNMNLGMDVETRILVQMSP